MSDARVYTAALIFLIFASVNFLSPKPAFAGSKITDYLCELGTTYYRMERYDEALEEFKKVLMIEPDNPVAKKFIQKIFKLEDKTVRIMPEPAPIAREPIPEPAKVKVSSVEVHSDKKPPKEIKVKKVVPELKIVSVAQRVTPKIRNESIKKSVAVVTEKHLIDRGPEKSAEQRDLVMEVSLNRIVQKKENKKTFLYPNLNDTVKGKKVVSIGATVQFLAIDKLENAFNYYFESENEDKNVASTEPSSRRRLYFEENLETDIKGSVYHPNLASFDINLKNGLKQMSEKLEPNSSGKLKNGPLNYFHVIVSALREKPYAFTLMADKSREEDNREFFERQIINSTGYGGNFGFRNSFVPIGLSFSNTNKTVDRVTSPSQEIKDEILGLNLSNSSKTIGESTFELTQDKFSRTESDSSDQKGTSLDLNLANQKEFSPDKDKSKSLYSTLRYFDISGTSPSSLLNWNEDFYSSFAKDFNGTLNYGFSDNKSGDVKTIDHRFSSALKHQLYESLTSTLSPFYSISDSTTYSQDNYGVSFNEDYVKKLGKVGRLSAGVGRAYEHEKRITNSAVVSMIDEQHLLSDGTVTFLDRPSVDSSSVQVTSSDKTVTYVNGVDYELTLNGSQTQIARKIGGGIASGDTVLVNYVAAAEPSAKFDTLTDNFNVRMDFLDNLIGVYYRLLRQRHPNISAQEDIILERLDDIATGLDLHYRNFTAGLEDEDYDSSLSPYRQLRFRESVFINPSYSSTLTLESSQSKLRLINTQDNQRFFDVITRYDVSLNKNTRYNIEGGYRWQRGAGVDLDEISAGSGLELNVGKMYMNLKYSFIKQLYLGDELTNHFVSFWLKRKF